MSRRRIYTCSVCHKAGHDRRAHVLPNGLIVNLRSIKLGPVSLTVELRGDITELSPDQRALVFAIADLISDHEKRQSEATP